MTTECSSSDDDQFAEEEVNALKDINCTNPTHMKTNPSPLVHMHVEQDLNTDGSRPSKISKALTAMYMSFRANCEGVLSMWS